MSSFTRTQIKHKTSACRSLGKTLSEHISLLEEISFQLLLEVCDTLALSEREGEAVPKSWCTDGENSLTILAVGWEFL